jgi:hypothetical protein
MNRDAEQLPTRLMSIETVMRPVNFRLGVEDVRAGRRPRFDDPNTDDGYWSYERGRQWGAVAPLSMPLWINGQLNPKAVTLLSVALKRGLIR